MLNYQRVSNKLCTCSQDILHATLPDDVAHFREWWLTIQPKLAPEGGQNSHLQIVALLGLARILGKRANSPIRLPNTIFGRHAFRCLPSRIINPHQIHRSPQKCPRFAVPICSSQARITAVLHFGDLPISCLQKAQPSKVTSKVSV